MKRESGEQGARAPALSPQRAPRPALRGQSAPLVLSLRLLLCSHLGHLPAALLAVRAPGGEERRGERDERAQKKALSRARPALFDGAPQECPGAWAAQPRHGACTIRWSTQKTNGIQEMCPSREGWVREKTKPRRCVVAPHSRFFFATLSRIPPYLAANTSPAALTRHTPTLRLYSALCRRTREAAARAVDGVGAAAPAGGAAAWEEDEDAGRAAVVGGFAARRRGG